MPHSANGKTRVGDLERAVLETLWESGDWLTVREVHARLVGERDIAYTTVMTVLDRMAKKNLVDQERTQGRAFGYRASGTRAELTADLMRETLDEFADQDRGTALVAFVGDASDEERAALRRALAALEDGR